MEPLTHSIMIQTMTALVLTSLASFAGCISFALGKRLNRVLPYLLSAAIGALLATSLTHLLPEAAAHIGIGRELSLLLVAGILLSFLIDRFLSAVLQPHRHDGDVGPVPAKRHLLAANILVSGGVHSLLDGIAIATGFAVGPRIGVATTVAVLLHELPHHVADIAVLIFSGVSRWRAVFLNLLATLGCVLGGALVLVSGSKFQPFTTALLPVTAANFLYVSLAVLLPQVQRQSGAARFSLQLGALVAAAMLVTWLGGLHE